MSCIDIRILCFGTMALIGIVSCSTAPRINGNTHAPDVVVDICSVVAYPALYDGQVLLLHGKATPPDHSQMLVTSEGCTGAIALEFDEALATTPEKEQLDVEVWTAFPYPHAGTPVTLVGKFVYKKGRRPSRILTVTSISFPDRGTGDAPVLRRD